MYTIYKLHSQLIRLIIKYINAPLYPKKIGPLYISAKLQPFFSLATLYSIHPHRSPSYLHTHTHTHTHTRARARAHTHTHTHPHTHTHTHRPHSLLLFASRVYSELSLSAHGTLSLSISLLYAGAIIIAVADTRSKQQAATQRCCCCCSAVGAINVNHLADAQFNKKGHYERRLESV